MASRDLNALQPAVQVSARRMLEAAEEVGFGLLIYCTHRDVEEQARLFRRGRTLKEIQTRADELAIQWQRPDLGMLLMEVGAQHGPRVTNAGPGQSLHNYGMALDGCPLLEGKPIWGHTTAEERALWDTYGELGLTAGLEWAGHWRSFKEFPHFQDPILNWRDLIREFADEAH